MLDALIATGLSAVSKSKLTVMTFHRVLPERDLLNFSEPTGEQFEALLETWARWFNFVPLAQGVRMLRNRQLGRRTACITFDDGYMNNFEVAAPILQKLGLPATFFIATSFSDGGMMFNDKIAAVFRQASGESLDLSFCGMGVWPVATAKSKRESSSAAIQKIKHFAYSKREALADAMVVGANATIETQPMMTRPQVQQLAKMGFEIGAHTVTHPILRELSDEDAEREIRRSRVELQTLTGQAVEMFAYPNGQPGKDYDLRHTKMVKDAGFIGAVSTITGAATASSDLYQIPRFTPWHGTTLNIGVQFLRNYRKPVQAL